MERMIDDNIKQKLLDELAEEPPMVISTAYIYAKNYVTYGEDITKLWATAVQQQAILESARLLGWQDGYDSFKADYENRLKADLEAILVDLQLDVEGQKFDTHMDKDVWNDAIRVCSELIQQKINELPPVTPQEPRWIPVDDPYTELPKKDLWVTRNDNGNLCVDKIYYDMTEWNDYIGDVVAYMEYKEPVPYKEVIEE